MLTSVLKYGCVGLGLRGAALNLDSSRTSAKRGLRRRILARLARVSSDRPRRSCEMPLITRGLYGTKEAASERPKRPRYS